MKAKIIALTLYTLVVLSIGILTKQETWFHPEFREAQPSSSFGVSTVYAYPPGVGILTNSTSCLNCHIDNGPWKDDENTIIDILDKETKNSLKQSDGTFLIEVKRGEPKTVLTVIGSKKSPTIPSPYRNAWLYIDPATIGTSSLSKFAPNWDVNLPMSCRLVGDNVKGFEEANITSLPMTIAPLELAEDTEISLQVMLTKGEATKNDTHEGMTGNYFERKVKLRVK